MSETREVWFDQARDGWFCDAGQVQSPKTAWHPTNNRRPCFHAVQPLPVATLFGRKHIMAYGFQLLVFTGTWPCLIKRDGDIVTMAFDREGPVDYCTHTPTTLFSPAASYRYRLSPIHWFDDEPTDDILLGVWPD